MQQNEVGSILAIDIGAAFTRAALFDLVNGQRRFMACGRVPTTVQAPTADVSKGVVGAISRLEEIVGRRLLVGSRPITPERTTGEGVDACYLVGSAGNLLRVLVASTTAAGATRLVREVQAVPEAAVIDVLSLDTRVGPSESRIGRLLSLLHRERPDVLLVVDGDAGKTGLAEIAQGVAVNASDGSRSPAIVFCGDEEGLAVVQRGLPEGEQVHHLKSPSSGGNAVTPLQACLQSLWQGMWKKTTPGADALEGWSSLPVHSTQHGFSNVLRFLAAQDQVDVWGLDVGAQNASAVAMVGGKLTAVLHNAVGLGQGSLSLLPDASAIGRWLPINPKDGELSGAILNKHLFPTLVPETESELLFEAAMARVVGANVLDRLPVRQTGPARNTALLVAHGAVFADQPSDGHAILLLLDTFQPVGWVDLAIDRLGILPMLGVIACEHPQAAAELLLRDGLRRLGPCIGIGGVAKGESTAAKVTLERGNKKATVTVPFGKIKTLPLEEGEPAKVSASPSGKLDCGGGRGRKMSMMVRGGPRGVIVDARGRPVTPANPQERRLARLADWREALGGRIASDD